VVSHHDYRNDPLFHAGVDCLADLVLQYTEAAVPVQPERTVDYRDLPGLKLTEAELAEAREDLA
jgi:hypothetical protein